MFLAGLLLLVGQALSGCRAYKQTLNLREESDDLAKIAHGQEPTPNAYPFVANLRITLVNGSSYRCGGALINPSYVLTAAHCLVYYDNEKKIRLLGIQVILGAHDTTKEEANRIIRFADLDASVIADDYNRITAASDVALIRLNEPVKFNQFIKPICLAPQGSSHVGQTAVAVGWGATGTGKPSSNVLLEVKQPVLEDRVCADVFGRRYDKSVMLCAGYTDGTGDTCQGDSGGPLFVKGSNEFISIGVVSFGSIICARTHYPAVYAEVQHFVSWIRENADGGGSICVA